MWCLEGDDLGFSLQRQRSAARREARPTDIVAVSHYRQGKALSAIAGTRLLITARRTK